MAIDRPRYMAIHRLHHMALRCGDVAWRYSVESNILLDFLVAAKQSALYGKADLIPFLHSHQCFLFQN